MPDDLAISDSQPQTGSIPAWITPALIERTRVVWQPYYDHLLSEADAVEILISAGALCDVLFFDSPLDNEAELEPPAIRERKSA